MNGGENTKGQKTSFWRTKRGAGVAVGTVGVLVAGGAVVVSEDRDWGSSQSCGEHYTVHPTSELHDRGLPYFTREDMQSPGTLDLDGLYLEVQEQPEKLPGLRAEFLHQMPPADTELSAEELAEALEELEILMDGGMEGFLLASHSWRDENWDRQGVSFSAEPVYEQVAVQAERSFAPRGYMGLDPGDGDLLWELRVEPEDDEDDAEPLASAEEVGEQLVVSTQDEDGTHLAGYDISNTSTEVAQNFCETFDSDVRLADFQPELGTRGAAPAVTGEGQELGLELYELNTGERLWEAEEPPGQEPASLVSLGEQLLVTSTLSPTDVRGDEPPLVEMRHQLEDGGRSPTTSCVPMTQRPASSPGRTRKQNTILRSPSRSPRSPRPLMSRAVCWSPPWRITPPRRTTGAPRLSPSPCSPPRVRRNGASIRKE